MSFDTRSLVAIVVVVTPKTSITDPIRVDYLPSELLGLPGRVGMTFAPGKKDRGVYALWDRDLDSDLTRLIDVYDTDLLVSLVEDSELRAMRISHLASRIEALGPKMSLRRWPFRDAGVPASVDAASELVAAVLDAATAGRNVVIHCRGGLGRTGLVAACCLVARGRSARDAIADVRAVRPGAVETAEQEAFVARFEQSRVTN